MKGCISFLTFMVLLSSCKVGPEYSPPPTLTPTYFVENRPYETTPVSDEDLFHWWEETFNDPFLDQLLEEALQNNFDLRIAWERVFQARANYWIQFASILPDFEGDFQATRFRVSQSFASARAAAAAASTTTPTTGAVATTISPYQDFFQIGLDAVWEIDLFGKLRRNAQSAFDAWGATIEDARGIKITVLSEVANIYVAICYFQTKANFARQLVEFDEGLAAMSYERFQAGLANEKEVDESLSTLETDKAALNVFEISLKQNIYSLGVLLGRPPETLIADFSINRPIPIASGKIPETLPSELLRRRPDIASAERTLAAQTEQIGVAVAELFPTVSLIGSSSSFAANPLQGANVGYSSDSFSKLFNPKSRIWGIGTLVTFPVFDFGKRYANVDVQKFLANQDYLVYQKTVITAFQEVETSLSTYFQEEERLGHFSRQAEHDRRNLELILDQFQAGLANLSDVLQARGKWLLSANLLTDSQEAIDRDLIAVYKAIGGDW